MTGRVAPKQPEQRQKQGPNQLDILKKISSTVDKIYENVLTLNKLLASSDEKDRVQRIRSERGRREARLEKKPFEGFINTIKKYLNHSSLSGIELFNSWHLPSWVDYLQCLLIGQANLRMRRRLKL